MLQPEFQLFDTAMRQWMGTSQISICIVFLVIYFSRLSLQEIIEVRQNSKSNQIMHCMGKNKKQIERLVNKQIAIKLLSPMIMALLIILFCIPLLNGKMNLVLPVSAAVCHFRRPGGASAPISDEKRKIYFETVITRKSPFMSSTKLYVRFCRYIRYTHYLISHRGWTGQAVSNSENCKYSYNWKIWVIWRNKMVDIYVAAAFSKDDKGGNKAGVVLGRSE